MLDERRLFLTGVASDACARAANLIAHNRFLEALAAFDHALDAVEDHEPAVRGVMAIAERLTFTKYSPRLERLLRRCLLSPQGNPEALVLPIGRLLQVKYGLPSHSSWGTDAVVTEDGIQRLSDDILLMAYLSSTVNQNLPLERFLVLVRHELARRFLNGKNTENWFNLAAALAMQVHNNEYIWPITDEEAQWPDAAATRMESIDCGDRPDDQFLGLYLAYAMFRDPYDAARFRKWARKVSFDQYPSAFRSLVDRTLMEPAKRAQIQRSLPRPTAIDDKVSRKVRKLYETNAYPRWLGLTIPLYRSDPHAMLKSRFPHLADLPAREGPTQVLMPGVGTGRHALWAATRFADVEIVATDLSLRSLAYGKWMAERYGVDNVTFMQGDILALDGQFDRIECTGVLHHMENPESGFQRLAECLKPGGVMQVMVYAEGNREEIYRLRSVLGGIGRGTSYDVIRRTRERIVQEDGDLVEFSGLAQRPDFHSTSGFKDLIMHVQESAFTVARVREMVDSSDLRFIGFEFTTGRVMQMFAKSDAELRYREIFPDDATLSDLANWEKLERDHENLFNNYYFWCQKPLEK